VRRARGRIVVAGVLATMLLAAGCAALSGSEPVRGTPGGPLTAGPCTASAMRSCALPYPSDEFTVADPAAATGRRVVIPDDIVPASVRRTLGPGASVQDAFAAADGFSAVGPVMFELDRAADAATLPADGGDVVRVYDTSTGRAVPIRAELSLDAIRQGAPGTILSAWPAVRWEYGHTYVARVTSSLRGVVGSLERAPGVVAPGPYLSSVRADLARAEGDRWAQVVSATRFTVRSRANATAELDTMAAVARSVDHPVRNLSIGPALFVDGASTLVRGEVSLSDFRDADGVVRPDRPPVSGWEKFVMVLPDRPAGPDGAPVVVYGHGLTVAKETMLAVASDNARMGMATIGIDVPNHGDRQDEGGYLLDLTSPGRFGRLASMPAQGVVDTVSLVRAITTHLATLDVAPWRPGAAGDGVADLDTSRLLYEGTSMGGVLGASSVALTPEFDGAYLQVAGSGIADIIFHSLLWPLFATVVPDGASAGDAAALQGAATMLLDRADNANVVDRVRGAGPPVFLQFGVGDGIVPNVTSERLISLADLPLVGPELAPMRVEPRRTGGDAIPADGRGVAEVYNVHSSSDTLAFMAHISFLEPQAELLLQAWLRNRLLAMGLTPPA
jgi:hypothetical protein